MNKRKLFNILCIILGISCIALAFVPSPTWERIIYVIAGLSGLYIGYSGLRIK